MVESFWPRIEGYIVAALERGSGDDTLEDIRQQTRDGSTLVWIWWDPDISVVFTTRIIGTRRGRVCLITTLAGHHLKDWKHMITKIEQYGRDEDCVAIRFSGRKGWKRIFPDYREPWITLEKALT
jgi:hypothetical protein